QRLSVALLYLVSQFARRLLNGMDRRLPKAIFLDEAWAITCTPEGARLVTEVGRMGRSRNTALVLFSEKAGDLVCGQVTNCRAGGQLHLLCVLGPLLRAGRGGERDGAAGIGGFG